MTYDFHGGWEYTTNFNAPLYAVAADPTPTKTTFNSDYAINLYLQGGVPASKVVMGVPFYARGWAGVPSTNNGLFQSATGPAPGTFEAGIFDFKELASLSGFTRYFSNEAKVPWLYNPQTKVMITYDDPQAMGIKADYINQKGLGGAMFWELSGDDATHSLLNVLNSKFGH
jgi:chitinase